MDESTDSAWQCPQCTLLNSVEQRRCLACDWEAGDTGRGLAVSAEDAEARCKVVIDALLDAQALSTLVTLIGNAADHPTDPKYRGPVRKANNKIQAAIVNVPGASDVLSFAGFEEDGEAFRLPLPDPPRLSRIRNLLLARQERLKTVRPKNAPSQHQQGAAPAARERIAVDPAPSRATAPPLCEKAVAPDDVVRIRVKLPLPFSGRMDIEMTGASLVSDLQAQLAQRTGIRPTLQRIRYGFPSKVLEAGPTSTLLQIGIHDGEVFYLESYRDLFLTNLESGSYTMDELGTKLPNDDEEGDNSTGTLFLRVLHAFKVPSSERNFWHYVEGQIRQLSRGWVNRQEAEDLQLGLRLIQRLFDRHDPQERLALLVRCLPRRSDPHFKRTLLQVKRTSFLSSVAPQVLGLSQEQLLSPILVQYVGEPGVDQGGLTRDFFSNVASALATDEPTLWRLTGRGQLRPVPDAISFSSKHSSGLKAPALYRACGRVFGLAVLHTCKLGRPLSRTFVQLLANVPAKGVADLQAEFHSEAGDDVDFRGSLKILEEPLSASGLSGVLTFTHSFAGNSQLETELIPGGKNVLVTDENKKDWLEAWLHHELYDGIKQAVDAFRTGLMDVFGGTGIVCPLLSIMDVPSLVELWGKGCVERSEIARWRAMTRVSPVVAIQAAWFWQVLEEDYDDELRGKVLQFSTGASSLGRWGLSQTFIIEPANGGDERLPSAMTCANMLQLPRYSCRAVLSMQLRTAAELGASFQFS